MQFRVSGMTTGSRWSLCHFVATTVAVWVAQAGRGHDSALIPFVVLAFPLGYVLRVLPYDWLIDHFSHMEMMLIVVSFLALNSYLWGHTAAFVQRRIARVRTGRDEGRGRELF
jgi:hypothetical protein